MLKVFKYHIRIDDYLEIDLPEQAKILTVDTQRGTPYMWVLCNPELPIITRKFKIAGTGHPIEEEPDNLNHIGTFQLYNGDLIFHVFEVFTHENAWRTLWR